MTFDGDSLAPPTQLSGYHTKNEGEFVDLSKSPRGANPTGPALTSWTLYCFSWLCRLSSLAASRSLRSILTQPGSQLRTSSSNSVTASERLISLGSVMGVFCGFSRVNAYTVVSGKVDRFCWSEGSCGEETASAHAMTKSIS